MIHHHSRLKHHLFQRCNNLTIYHRLFSTKKRMITTPIFYVNGAPHIGHLYSALQADALSRWFKMKNEDVLFTTGTDEHGLKIQEAANAAGMTPSAFCDKNSAMFRELFAASDIQFHKFNRTTSTSHISTVQNVWKKLSDDGHIYLGQHEAWYCKSDESFLTDTQVTTVVEDKKAYKVSKESGHRVEMLCEENYKFKLSAFQDKLLAWLRENPTAIVPCSRYNDVIKTLESTKLNDISISRLRQKIPWGIPVQESEKVMANEPHTIYVWLDALVSYLSNETKEAAWPADYQILGKDILKFHAIYWPAFLMALNLPLPSKLVVHGHWLVNGTKMSKSLNNIVDPHELLRRFGVDPVRYFLLRDGSIKHDANFTQEFFGERFNSDLANTLGNLVSRSTATALCPSQNLLCEDDVCKTYGAEFREKFNGLSLAVENAFEKPDFVQGTTLVIEFLYEANRFFQENEPWKIAKELKNCEGDKDLQERLDSILYLTHEAARVSTILLQPIIPASAARILDHLQVPSANRTLEYARIGAEKRPRVLATTNTKFVPFPKLE